MNRPNLSTPSLQDVTEEQTRRNQVISIILAMAALSNVIIVIIASGFIAGGGPAFIVAAIIVAWVVIAYLIYNQTVLRSTGARDPTSNEANRLHPMVDRTSQSLGISDIAFKIIDDDAANAFAVGTGPKATVVFSTGLLTLLEDDELEGVVAHELAHIANGDTRIALYSAALLGWAIVVSVVTSAIAIGIGHAGLGVMASGDRNDDWTATLAKFCLGCLMILAAIGTILAVQTWLIVSKLSHTAVFRQREWIADTTAALVTAKPLALASALEKAGSENVALQKGSGAARALCIFGYDASSWWDNLFSTHPSLDERIHRLKEYAALTTEQR